MKILVLGASGLTGREIVKQALEQNHTVTAFVRDPAKLEVEHNSLKVVQGDVSDKAAIEAAVAGQDAVLSALGPTTVTHQMPELTDGIRYTIEAMEKNGVRRFVYQSALGAGDSREEAGFLFEHVVRPLMLSKPYADHEEQEAIISASPLDWIIVRPGALTNGERTGEYQTGVHIEPKGLYGSVSRADVADFMLKQLTEDRYLRQSPSIYY